MHRTQRRSLVRDIAQSEADGDAIERSVGKWQSLGIGHQALDVAGHACIEQPVAPELQHRGIDVRKNHAPILADLAQHPCGEIAGAAGHVQCPLTRLQARERQCETLPKPMHTE